jgi:hypothetical protein
MDQDFSFANPAATLDFIKQLSDPASVLGWLVETILPLLGGNILEAESDEGGLSAALTAAGLPIYISAADGDKCQRLLARTEGNALVQGILQLDFERNQFAADYIQIVGAFRIVLALQLTGQSASAASATPAMSLSAIRNTRHLLAERGRLILITPATTVPFEGMTQHSFESALYPSIRKLMGEHDEIIRIWPFNILPTVGPAGVAGAVVSGATVTVAPGSVATVSGDVVPAAPQPNYLSPGLYMMIALRKVTAPPASNIP